MARRRTTLAVTMVTVTLVGLLFLLLGRSDLRFLLVRHGCLRWFLRLADVLHVVRRRLDLARHEAVNALGP
jgi:hypothetical protein